MLAAKLCSAMEAKDRKDNIGRLLGATGVQDTIRVPAHVFLFMYDLFVAAPYAQSHHISIGQTTKF